MQQLTDQDSKHIRRLQELRDAVGIEILKIEVKSNDLIIIRPKDDTVRFTTQYCHWLSEVLRDKLPNDVGVILLGEYNSSIMVASPPESGEEYMRGWNNALNTVIGGTDVTP